MPQRLHLPVSRYLRRCRIYPLRAHRCNYTGEREAGKSGIGAGIGSLVGAGVGALSSSKKDRGKGALIGAAAGAALGGGVGYYMDVQEAKLRDKMKGTGVSVTRSGDNIILNMPNNVTFDSSSATLKPAGANTLTGVAMVLKEYNRGRAPPAPPTAALFPGFFWGGEAPPPPAPTSEPIPAPMPDLPASRSPVYGFVVQPETASAPLTRAAITSTRFFIFFP